MYRPAKTILTGMLFFRNFPAGRRSRRICRRRSRAERKREAYDVLAHLGQPMIDVRSPGEYSGELLHMPDYPQEGALRGGHIPGAQNVPGARAARADATFRLRAELEAIYLGEAGLRPGDDVV